jgi:uncharacterized membrane protein HdeD (DUF308 family)
VNFSECDEKAMAYADRNQIVRKRDHGSTDRAKELFAGVLLGALIATIATSDILPPGALAPAIATLLFVLGAATAALALLCGRDRASMWFDIAGVLTFVGIAVSILIEPDQLVRLFALSDQPD